jgi:hypothetical protein
VAGASGASGNGDSVDDVADELYALPADEFVAARNDRAKAARAAGAREVATAIAKLAKPNAAAWLANQLARAHADDVQALVELGVAMRDATAALDRDKLRGLSTRQRQLMASLVGWAREIAQASDRQPNETTIRDLEDILHAALAEPDAADQLTAGRLTGTLRSSGFPSDDAFSSGDMAMWSASAPNATSARPLKKSAQTNRSSTRPSGRDRPDDADASPARKQRDISAEQRALDEAAKAAQEDRDAAQQDLERAERAVRDARTNADRVRRQLDDAVDALTTAEQERRAARTRADQTERAARLATRRLDAVKRRT